MNINSVESNWVSCNFFIASLIILAEPSSTQAARNILISPIESFVNSVSDNRNKIPTDYINSKYILMNTKIHKQYYTIHKHLNSQMGIF